MGHLNLHFKYFSERNIDQKLFEKLEKVFFIRNIQPECTILNMGENKGVVYLILKGIVRGYYLDEDENSITKCFSKEGDWCGLYNLLTQEPSLFYLETLEESIVAEVSVSDLKHMVQQHEEVREIYDEQYYQAILLTEEKGVSFQMMSGKERYKFFQIDILIW